MGVSEWNVWFRVLVNIIPINIYITYLMIRTSTLGPESHVSVEAPVAGS